MLLGDLISLCVTLLSKPNHSCQFAKFTTSTFSGFQVLLSFFHLWVVSWALGWVGNTVLGFMWIQSFHWFLLVSRIDMFAINGSIAVRAGVLWLEVLIIFSLCHIQVASRKCGSLCPTNCLPSTELLSSIHFGAVNQFSLE